MTEPDYERMAQLFVDMMEQNTNRSRAAQGLALMLRKAHTAGFEEAVSRTRAALNGHGEMP